MEVLWAMLAGLSVQLLGGAIAALLAGLGVNLFGELLVPQLRLRFGLEKQKAPKPYREQMAKLTQGLVKASADVDRILQEMTEVSSKRESAISELEQELEALTERERHLQEKIETLQQVPLPAVEHFAGIVERGEKRSAWRDYALFGLGVITSTVIAIILGLVGF